MTLDPPGSVDTRPLGITDTGDIVGLYFTADSKGHGFLLTRGVYTSLDVPGAIRTNAVGVAVFKSKDRDDDEDANRTRADSGGGARRRDDAGALRGLAVVGRYDTPDGMGHGYLLSSGVLTTIDVPDSTFSVATGINSSGHIVGRFRSRADGRLYGFTLIDGEFTTIDYPGALHIHGMAINTKGDIAGHPGSISTYFTGINRRGDIVGLYHDGTRFHGLLHTRGDHK